MSEADFDAGRRSRRLLSISAEKGQIYLLVLPWPQRDSCFCSSEAVLESRSVGLSKNQRDQASGPTSTGVEVGAAE